VRPVSHVKHMPTPSQPGIFNHADIGVLMSHFSILATYPVHLTFLLFSALTRPAALFEVFPVC